MIEVEIKIKITEEQKQWLTTKAKFLSSENHVDIYFDTSDYRLTSNGYWLRTRNGSFMLKKPAAADNSFNINANLPFHEIVDEEKIKQALNLSAFNTLKKAVAEAGYVPIYTLETNRKKYKLDGIIIDVDHTNYGNLEYEICELELMVENQDQTQAAFEKLHQFAIKYGLSTNKAEGKLFYFIKRTNPKHYKALTESRTF